MEDVDSSFLRAEVLSRLRREGFADADVEIRHIEGGASNWTADLTKPVGQDGAAARRAIITRIQPDLRSKYNLAIG
ncbi:MAG TPA: hypothetical protein VGC77_09290 [Rhodopseudomonas sp.]|uniref:hypothetical protein n=1 Tax=Rhodopseudomonas sp. TaxID=1078 RepID=UPI002ED94615